MRGWKEFYIQDLGEILNHKRVPLNSMQRIKRQGVYPYYGASGIVDYIDDFIFEGEHVLISEDGENLVSRKAPIAFIASGQFWVNNHAHIFKAKDSSLQRLVGYLLNSYDLNEFITGAAQPKLSKAALCSIPFFLPASPCEQKAIAAVLSSLDDKIDLLHRQNATLEGMAEALFRQWFVVEAKDEWEEGRLGDFAVNVKDTVNPSKLSAGTIYLGLEHIEKKSLSQVKYGDSTSVLSNKFTFQENDILFGKLRPYFHKVCMATTQGICSTDILVIRPRKSEYFCFCLFAFFQNDVVDYASLASGGTRMPRTDWKTLKDYPIAKPDVDTLQEFNKLVEPALLRIKFNITQIRTLEKLRDTLLPKLMSGEVRVEV